MKLSTKMLEAGWNIIPQKNGSFTVLGSGTQEYRFDARSGEWSAPLESIEAALENDLALIEEDRLSPITTASRLTALDHTRQSSQPIKHICANGLASGRTVLHLGTGRDRFAEKDLMLSGCIEVVNYDPNFYPDPQVLDKTYDIVIANYLFNILPPKERCPAYRLVEQTLTDTGCAYLTVQGTWPVEHKYEIMKRHEDGYLIKTGYNVTFRKGYEPEGFVEEIKEELGGRPEILKMFYSNTMVRWTKS